MSRRTGNNYSGPRWLFKGEQKPKPAQEERDHWPSMMGGNALPTAGEQDRMICPECEEAEVVGDVGALPTCPNCDWTGWDAVEPEGRESHDA